MGLLERWKHKLQPAGSEPGGLTTSSEQLQALLEAIPERTPIGECVPRTVVRIGGIVTNIEAEDSPAQRFSVCINDGTGALTLIWLGRGPIPGIAPGVFLAAKGTVGSSPAGIHLLDPQYSIQVSQS